MTPVSDKPLIRACYGKQPARYPAWFLRQAGRYLPEYLQIRSQLSFLELCRDASKAAEVTLQPLKRFDLDAAIIFSDILIPPASMGMDLSFDKGHGPVLKDPIRSEQDLKALRIPDWERDAPHTGNAIAETVKGLKPHQSMIGFAGAPFTVGCYMVEGCGTKTYSEVKKMLFTRPEVFRNLMEILTEATAGYLRMQVQAGAEVLMLFDTWAGNLAPGDYRLHVAPIMHKLCHEIKKLGVPLILYPGQGGEVLHALSDIAADVIAADWRVPLDRVCSILRDSGHKFRCVQGNLDPMMLSWASEEKLREAIREIRQQAVHAPAHIFNVGHGLLPTSSERLIHIALEELRA